METPRVLPPTINYEATTAKTAFMVCLVVIASMAGLVMTGCTAMSTTTHSGEKLVTMISTENKTMMNSTVVMAMIGCWAGAAMTNSMAMQAPTP